MPYRVIALFLSLVLLWSGLATVEAPHVLAQPAPEPGLAVVIDADEAALQHGSVEHHHLDDLPSQAQGDPPGDPPALPTMSWASGLRPAAVVLRHAPAPAEALPPFLAGPLRPPRQVALAG